MIDSFRPSVPLVLLVCCALLVVPAPPADASPSEAVACALGGSLTAYMAEGYRVRTDDTDRLRKGHYMDYTLTLVGGVDYLVFACGDNGVRDLDLLVADENGNIVARDQARDAIPVVGVRPTWTGPFKLRVLMYDAVGGPAYYSVVVLYR